MARGGATRSEIGVVLAQLLRLANPAPLIKTRPTACDRTPEMQEAPEETIRRRHVVVDPWEACWEEARKRDLGVELKI